MFDREQFKNKFLLNGWNLIKFNVLHNYTKRPLCQTALGQTEYLKIKSKYCNLLLKELCD